MSLLRRSILDASFRRFSRMSLGCHWEETQNPLEGYIAKGSETLLQITESWCFHFLDHRCKNPIMRLQTGTQLQSGRAKSKLRAPNFMRPSDCIVSKVKFGGGRTMVGSNSLHQTRILLILSAVREQFVGWSLSPTGHLWVDLERRLDLLVQHQCLTL
ncbi:hypothetical protein ATANTOWER_009643 [Ataeniobius toweri]|uniref:Uncharacterized protein n=1 Tax=Ataeniobius toweri TaxID=208326 RepID=A0ABU7C1G4_9TELE|nr:hypothetical protein [Ataeniobius toweri]